ncbi:MAG: SDR family oxidoreductase [Gammaproteobacteria bacterium]|nr:SDR family oxidoreductase [Gammaproteobacteria bacterium]
MSLRKIGLTFLLSAVMAIASAAPADELVLVAGATGRTGQQIVIQLQEQGYGVRALVRDATSAAEKLGPDVELVVGDVRDPKSLVLAFTGVTRVISSIGASEKEGPNSPEFVDYEGNKNLIDTAINTGAEQFVFVSSMGVTHEDHVLNRIFGDVLIWKMKAEDYLRASGITYTVIRPGGLHDKSGGEHNIIFEQLDEVKVVAISRTDVAAVCVAVLAYPEAQNKTFEVFTIKQPPDVDWQAKFVVLN